MYESSCSYQSALELKRGASACPGSLGVGVGVGIKSEEFTAPPDWPAYRFCNPSTFEQLKQSVEKAKQALQDRSGFLGAGSAFSDLYSGVASTSRPNDVQDVSSRSRDESSDLKRTHGQERSEKSSHSHVGSPKGYNSLTESLSRSVSKCVIGVA